MKDQPVFYPFKLDMLVIPKYNNYIVEFIRRSGNIIFYPIIAENEDLIATPNTHTFLNVSLIEGGWIIKKQVAVTKSQMDHIQRHMPGPSS